MPFKDIEKRREYFREYMAKKRHAGQAYWELTPEAKAAKTRQKRIERARKKAEKKS